MLKVGQFFKPNIHQNRKMKSAELNIYFNASEGEVTVWRTAPARKGVSRPILGV